MKRISLGIHVHAEPERLKATLASVKANTSHKIEILLLPDGANKVTETALAELSDLRQSAVSKPSGVAACFNRLVTISNADIIVLLESGSLVGPQWLDYLLAAFDIDPSNGLAGPTTNSAWNEQCVYPESGNSMDDIARTARQAALRFGNQVRVLEPLYSLADFCYVVKREVIEKVGAADEDYGLGPCWEMDYNIRAARAGFRGVWVCAAYVHRSPFTTRRKLEEANRFEVSKHLYQDKFCGARLRREKLDYRIHCRGDACANFAPKDLIQLYRPFSEITQAELSSITEQVKEQTSTYTPDFKPYSQVTVENEPLISCIMPTYNRRSFIPQAIRCFLRQDYSNSELIVIDDGTDSIAECVPQNGRIRYIRLDKKLSIGAKRNFACAQAYGDLIVHWDDDDWYPSWRLRAQLQSLVNHRADLCGSSQIFYYDAANDRGWEYKYSAPGTKWVGGNTLAYRKSFWEQNKFSDVQMGEDSIFLWNSTGKIIADLAEPALCVAMLHSGNTSPKNTSGVFWHSQPSLRIHELLGEDLHFYRAIRSAGNFSEWPLVSCIMPTYNRRAFIPLTLQLFLNQDYPNKELVIVDDGNDSIRDLTANIADVHYFHLPSRTSIGAKRNFAFQQAHGEIIAHWDDDDWYAPDRLRYQVMPILLGKADITGLENAFVLQLPQGEFWTVSQLLHQQMFVGNIHGGTLV
ncbi:MAG: glycosyltransferase, partial [Acidobacteriota bacterium]